ncbi:MAG: hypothetical protein J7460_13535, partial [Chloroflexus sp.]|nr:hypothetical protein [Chloroflexus sp.]
KPIDGYLQQVYNSFPVEPIDHVIRAPRYVWVTGFAFREGTRYSQHATPNAERKSSSWQCRLPRV